VDHITHENRLAVVLVTDICRPIVMIMGLKEAVRNKKEFSHKTQRIDRGIYN